MEQDTIAAISTPPGEGGIGVIRISGNKSHQMLQDIFKPARRSNNKNWVFEDKKMYYGYIKDYEYNITIDEALVVFMYAPATYTREPIAEIHCHGGMIPLQETLQLLFRKGARPAEPGEFTKRAFLNGRLDLTQAEAVMDIVSSKTKTLKNVAVNQIEGRLKEELSQLQSDLLIIMSNLEARIDFPDEELGVASMESLQSRLTNVHDEIEKMVQSFEHGKILREGVKTVIIGRPNVGKSSLLNLLLREDRAIVTEEPGTTRDIIEEVVNLDGIPLKIIDTAGIREARNIIEKIGVEKTHNSLEAADLVLIVLDSSQPLEEEDKKVLSIASNKTTLLVLNKTDLTEQLEMQSLENYAPQIPKVKLSALKGQGLDELEEKITSLIFGGQVAAGEELVITNSRHFYHLSKMKAAVEAALEAANQGMSEDLIAVDVREAYDNLGQITGESASEDILDRIFSEFCIGK